MDFGISLFEWMPFMFDRVHIWAVWGQEKKGAARIFNDAACFWRLVEAGIVENDDLPRLEIGHKAFS